MSFRIHISLISISSSVIAFQIILMQILSIVEWHHFAFMIISLALLGFGASGTTLALFKEWFVNHKENVLPLSMLMAGVFIIISITLSQFDFFRFDTYLLFADNDHIVKLFSTYLLFFIPFYFGAMSIGLMFVCYSKNIGKLYFSNLLGSGLGGIGSLFFLSVFDPFQSILAVSMPALFGGILLTGKSNRLLTIPMITIYAAVFVYHIINPVNLQSSQYKSISKTLNIPDAEIEISNNSPYGFIQVVKSDHIRYAPGLSLTFTGKIPVRKAVFNNGNWVGPILSGSKRDTNFVLDFTTDALVYKLAGNEKILVLNAGTGANVLHALTQGTGKVTAVEANAGLNSILLNELAIDSDSLYYSGNVELKEISPRTFLQLNSDFYDAIILPTVGAFGGTSGTQAIKEEFLFTAESFNLILDRLKPEGFCTVTSWMDYPYRNPLRLLSTIIEGMNKQEIEQPGKYIASIRSWGTITFLIKKTELTSNDIAAVKNFCERMNFDPVILPGLKKPERTKYNQLQDDSFFDYIDTLFSKNRSNFISEYPFRITAPTDNKPYLSQFLSWKNIPDIQEYFGMRSVPFFELGYLIVILTLIQIVIISIVLIIVPLFKLGWKGGSKLWTVLYFTGLGIGYMFIEIVLIQKFVMYFGSPIISASAVISFMLICSGIGSYTSSFLNNRANYFVFILSVVIILLLTYSFILDPLLNFTLHLPISIKIIVSFILVGIPAFVMGFPFPLGVKKLDETNQSQIPWAWGINSCLSVVSTVLATVVSVELGFAAIFLFASAAYGISFLSTFIKSNN